MLGVKNKMETEKMSVPFAYLEFVSDLWKSCFGEVRGRYLEQNIKATATDLTEARCDQVMEMLPLWTVLCIELILVIFFLKFFFTLENSISFFFIYSYARVQCCLPWNSMEALDGGN